MNKKDKLLSFSNGKQYVVADQCNYQGKDYYFACEVINNEPSDNFVIFNISKNNDNKEVISFVKDNEIVKEVSKKMSLN